jgi:polyisoprenoid-binding protein YceI
MRRIARGFRGRRAARGLRLVAAALLASAAPGVVDAAGHCYVVDANRSQVEFRLRYFGFFSPGGRFGHVAGTVRFDPERWESLAVSIRIDVDSLESRPRFWHDELLGAHFCDRARYPEIGFDGRRAEQTGPGTGLAFGTLTLRGVTRPVTLRARLAPAGDELDVDAETSVSRAEFGLGGVLPLASDEVSIALHLRAGAAGCGG